MKNIFICLILSLCLIHLSVYGHSPDFSWAVNAGGNGPDSAYGIGTDPDGNIYITGFFFDTAYFGDIQLISNGDLDVYIAKLDKDGNFLWAKGGGGVNFDAGHSIAVDAYGNSYITGRFRETVNFGPFTLSSHGGYSCNLFIVKLDTDGNWVWAKQAGGGGTASDRGYGITLDSSGNLFISGYIMGDASFGNIDITSSGGRDIFIAKMDTNGNFIWAVTAGGAQDDWNFDIAVDESGNTYITGDFTSTAYFGDTQLISAGNEDIYIAKIDSNGNFVWAVMAGGPGSNTGYRIAVDNEGNSYITGKFSQTAYFGGTELISSGNDDIFIAKLDNNGEFLWAKKAGGTGEDTGYGVIVDDSGIIYITGSFHGFANFGNIQLESYGLDDIFIGALDPNGEFLWIKRAGGTGNDRANDITLDSNNNIFITGYFYGTGHFGNNQIQSEGNIDIFIAKIDNSSQLVPVFRFFNTVRGGHLYTISEIERDYIINELHEWNYEGISFNVWNGPSYNTAPAYRFFNTNTGIHLYTISEYERDHIINELPEWNYEGINFYVSISDEIENSIPVFRFFNHVKGGHLYTISEIERDHIINELQDWNYEGISFYVIDI